MVTIVIPSVWTQDRRASFSVEEGPLSEVLKQFAKQRPDCRDRVIGPDGELLPFLNVCVDDRLVPRQDRATTAVPAGSTVILISPIAGG